MRPRRLVDMGGANGTRYGADRESLATGGFYAGLAKRTCSIERPVRLCDLWDSWTSGAAAPQRRHNGARRGADTERRMFGCARVFGCARTCCGTHVRCAHVLRHPFFLRCSSRRAARFPRLEQQVDAAPGPHRPRPRAPAAGSCACTLAHRDRWAHPRSTRARTWRSGLGRLSLQMDAQDIGVQGADFDPEPLKTSALRTSVRRCRRCGLEER